jgi:hypothetical protein
LEYEKKHCPFMADDDEPQFLILSALIFYFSWEGTKQHASHCSWKIWQFQKILKEKGLAEEMKKRH